MSKKLLIGLSGKKGSGKDTACAQILAHLLNASGSPLPYSVGRDGRLGYKEPGHPDYQRLDWYSGGDDAGVIQKWADASVDCFARPIKEFCEHVLGLSHEQCWGTDAEKNSLTALRWDTKLMAMRLPPEVLAQHAGQRNMTAREVMQVFGTDLMRSWKEDIWVDALLRRVQRSRERIVIVTDVRFEDELSGLASLSEAGWDVCIVRLFRDPYHNDEHASETALDHLPLDSFDIVVPGDLSIAGQADFLLPEIAERLGRIGYDLKE